MEASDAAIEASVVHHHGARIVVVNAGITMLRDGPRAQRYLDAVRTVFFRGADTALVGMDRDGSLATFGTPRVVAQLRDVDPRRLRWSRYTLPGRRTATPEGTSR